MFEPSTSQQRRDSGPTLHSADGSPRAHECAAQAGCRAESSLLGRRMANKPIRHLHLHMPQTFLQLPSERKGSMVQHLYSWSSATACPPEAAPLGGRELVLLLEALPALLDPSPAAQGRMP